MTEFPVLSRGAKAANRGKSEPDSPQFPPTSPPWCRGVEAPRFRVVTDPDRILREQAERVEWPVSPLVFRSGGEGAEQPPTAQRPSELASDGEAEERQQLRESIWRKILAAGTPRPWQGVTLTPAETFELAFIFRESEGLPEQMREADVLHHRLLAIERTYARTRNPNRALQAGGITTGQRGRSYPRDAVVSVYGALVSEHAKRPLRPVEAVVEVARAFAWFPAGPDGERGLLAALNCRQYLHRAKREIERERAELAGATDRESRDRLNCLPDTDFPLPSKATIERYYGATPHLPGP